MVKLRRGNKSGGGGWKGRKIYFRIFRLSVVVIFPATDYRRLPYYTLFIKKNKKCRNFTTATNAPATAAAIPLSPPPKRTFAGLPPISGWIMTPRATNSPKKKIIACEKCGSDTTKNSARRFAFFSIKKRAVAPSTRRDRKSAAIIPATAANGTTAA